MNDATMQPIEYYCRKLEPDDINRLPLFRYESAIRRIRTTQALTAAVRRLKTETVLGFDTETQPSFQKGVTNPPALLQLAGADTVYLIHINLVKLSPGLKGILSDPNVVKAGVAIHDDVIGLRGLSEFEPAGFVDLAKSARGCGIQTNGLRNMAANFLGYRISKGAQRSNWGRHDLSEAQVTYAATDAWVSREIYLWMKANDLVA